MTLDMPAGALSKTRDQTSSGGGDQTSSVGDQTTRERLLAAAAEVFAERGYEGTAVAEVARRAGLTTGAIYANFRDKAELLIQAIEQATRRVVEDMEKARSAGVSAAERFILMAQRMVTEPDDTDRRLLVEMFAASRRDPALSGRVGEVLGEMEAALAAMVERARADGDIRVGLDSTTLARFCLSIGVGYAHLTTAGRPPPDPEEWVMLASRVLAAMGAQSLAAGHCD